MFYEIHFNKYTFLSFFAPESRIVLNGVHPPHLTFPFTSDGIHVASNLPHHRECCSERCHTWPLMDLCENPFSICIQEQNCEVTGYMHI